MIFSLASPRVLAAIKSKNYRPILNLSSVIYSNTYLTDLSTTYIGMVIIKLHISRMGWPWVDYI